MILKRIITMFLSFFIGVALVYLFAVNNGADGGGINTGTQTNERQIQANTLSFDSKITGSLGPGDALIELTPTVVNGSQVMVKFSINTHSLSLGQFDLKKITTLEYEGNALNPVKAGRLGGHHSSGQIIFDVGEDIRDFTIRMKGIPEIPDRVYTWNVG